MEDYRKYYLVFATIMVNLYNTKVPSDNDTITLYPMNKNNSQNT